MMLTDKFVALTLKTCCGIVLLAGAVSCEDTGNVEVETPAPRLISIVPGTGYVGCTAIISGEYFSEVPEENIVTVDGTEVPVEAAARNRLTLTMPQHELGDVEVAVTVNGQKAPTVLDFTYAELPEFVVNVAGINPQSGYAGDEIVITGENFDTDPDKNKVTFGGVEAEVIKATRNSLRVKAPEHERGRVDVTVEVDGKTSSTYFIYVELMIESVSPSSGAEGVEVTIRGEGFSDVPAENKVTINGVAAAVKSSSMNELVVVMPDNPEGTYPFVITVGERTVRGGEFSYSGCWRVETVLGVPSGVTGTVEGTGTSARLWFAQDIVPDGKDNYMITIRAGGQGAASEYALYQMTSDYGFSKLINDKGSALLVDSHPWGADMDSNGTLYVAAKATGKLLSYSNSNLTDYTVSGLTTAGMNPMDVQVDKEDNIYLLLRGNGSAGTEKVVKIKDNTVQETYVISGGKLYHTILLSYDESKLFLFGNGSGDIRMIDLTNKMQSVIAGTGTQYADAASYTDGTPGNPFSATLGATEGAICDEDGTIYFSEIKGVVREFKPASDGDYTKGTITTIAGKAFENSPKDGLSTSARFNYPNGMCFAPDGRTIYMLDGTNNSTLRKIYYR